MAIGVLVLVASKRASALDLGRNCREDRDLLPRARRKLFGSRRFLFSVKGDKVARTPGQEGGGGKRLKNNGAGVSRWMERTSKSPRRIARNARRFIIPLPRERTLSLSLSLSLSRNPELPLLRVAAWGRRGEGGRRKRKDIRRVFFGYLISHARES